MYQFSYGEVVNDAPSEMRDRERHAIDETLALLRIARDHGPGSREMVDALFYLRRLWSIFIDDLNNPENELPDQLRAGLVSIGIWINKEIDRIRTGVVQDIDPLIEVNEIIRDGLR